MHLSSDGHTAMTHNRLQQQHRLTRGMVQSGEQTESTQFPSRNAQLASPSRQAQ